MNDLADTLYRQILLIGLPEPVREHRFHETRKWRFDLAWPHEMVAVECEGGVYSQGRHLRPGGFLGDIAKYNNATALGWSVYRVSATMIHDGTALKLVDMALVISLGRKGGVTAPPARASKPEKE
jgi:hypothetical protein